MAWLEQAPRDFGDLHATIDTTFLLFNLIFSYTQSKGISQGTNKGSTIRTCIDEFEVRYSTIELYPYNKINLSLSLSSTLQSPRPHVRKRWGRAKRVVKRWGQGLRGDRTLNQQICNPCVVPYYRLSPILVFNISNTKRVELIYIN